MILRFEVENWMSFRDRVTFCMVATRERQHGERVPRLGKYQIRGLPIAAVYGGNASGKTNLFKALSFAKKLVVHGTRQPEASIPVEPFRLDSSYAGKPSSFLFQILADDRIYEFSFSVTRKEVVSEKLVEITSSTEKLLYCRQDTEPIFHDSLSQNQRLIFTYEGTRSNQLFLTNSVLQNLDVFRPVYSWFRDSLELVAPDSRFLPFHRFIQEEDELYDRMNDMLMRLDTGILHLGAEEIPPKRLPIPQGFLDDLQEKLNPGTTVCLRPASGLSNDNERIIIESGEDGNTIIKKLVSYHRREDGDEVKFEVEHESDGSQRIIDLLPAFLELGTHHHSKVYVVDEIDRSLHTLLTRHLIEGYLASCSHETRDQLIFTTHDLLLMDQNLLRRDEMWVTERDKHECSDLIPFSDYADIRYDKDIRKSYLKGRLGGIPRLLVGSTFADCPDGERN